MQAETFNALSIPINETNLIEASAGTGKTWSIAALFLRLVVLERIPVDKVLVVTFTNAATAELKTRLRSRLDEALRELKDLPDDNASALLAEIYEQRSTQDNAPEFEPFLYEVLQRALNQEAASRVRLRLQAALNQFDHAGIFTIHGFCQRVLREFAFLCQVPFQISLSDDTAAAKQRIAADFWRKHVIEDEQRAQLCFDKNISLTDALNRIQNWFGRSEQHIQFQLAQPQHALEDLHAQLNESAQTILASLEDWKTSFVTMHPVLNGTTYKLPTYLTLFEDLAHWLPHQQWHKITSKEKHICNLDAAVLQEKTKKGQALSAEQLNQFAPLRRLLDLSQSLQTEQEALFDQLHLDLYRYLLPNWQQEKQRVQQLGFDDLLTDVAKALQDEKYGLHLASYLSEHMWQVALIDEFQDTDPLQYGIFDTIFRQHHKPVFLVGDPKQAIYRFRGADIHAYLQAKHEANRLYTLDTNRRTHQQLVASVNALFLNKDKPFLLNDIDYIDVQAARADSRLLPNDTPLEIQCLLQGDETYLNKEQAKPRAALYCALDIARHLALSNQGKLQYDGGPLQAKHIAVLVRTHGEGELVQKELRKEGISSVILSRDSIFAAEQAKPVLSLLQWWQAPQQQGLLRSVLASDLLNYRSSDLMRLNDADSQDELIGWMEDALQAQQVWQQRGVYAAWQLFDKKRGISADFLRRNDKRGLTNVQQLFELLAKEESERFGAASLIQWLNEQVSQQTSGDAYTLRLESDEELVKIVTMHASKGLQYPVVFCPFVWDNRDFKTSEFNIVHQNGQVRIVSEHCLSNDDEASLAEDERSETLRLLYVAFTRAEEKLILSCSLLKDNGSANNVLHHLIAGEPDHSWEQTHALWENAGKDKRVWYQDLWQQWAQKHHVNLLWRSEQPEYSGLIQEHIQRTEYTALQAVLPFYRFQEYTSFSGISRHISHLAMDELVPEIDVGELQDDQIILNEETVLPESHEFDIFHFQRGTDAGLCLHALLENTDFQQSAASQSDVYAPILERYHIADEWQPALYAMIDATRLAHLDAQICLADLPQDQCLAEMGFVLNVNQFTATDIQQCLLESELPPAIKQAAQGLHFRDVTGFLNGFIDLVCVNLNGKIYVIDYKSNHLGMLPKDYHTNALNLAINDHHYYLQALIYAIAVGRYLRSRRFDFDAIHIRYLFLRGLQPSSEQGVWRWDIGADELDRIDAVLAS